jgi:selenophosphate synthetase-related protein
MINDRSLWSRPVGTTSEDDGPVSLAALVEALRAAPGWRAKADIAVVGDVLGPGDWLRGLGDDGAVVAAGEEEVVACGEAILPAFVERDPHGAGVAAVLTNVNDVAAMGALPLAVVDTIVGSVETCRAALEGMRFASALYDVPVVGGHLTISTDRTALSAFAVGRCPGAALSAARVAPGQRLALTACLEGKMRPDFPFFPSFDERGGQLAGDVRLFADLATSGAVVAAKDVSMAGLFGSLAMLLEPTRSGVTVDLAAIPIPDGIDFLQWAVCFPCFAFLVTVPAGDDRAREAVEQRGLTYADLGAIDAGGRVVLTDGDDSAVVVDLGTEAVTGLRRGPT